MKSLSCDSRMDAAISLVMVQLTKPTRRSYVPPGAWQKEDGINMVQIQSKLKTHAGTLTSTFHVFCRQNPLR